MTNLPEPKPEFVKVTDRKAVNAVQPYYAVGTKIEIYANDGKPIRYILTDKGWKLINAS